MSQENVEMVRRTFERFVGSGEIAWEAMDPSVEIVDHDLPDAGEYHGHAGFSRWLGDWEEAWENFRLSPKEYIDGGADTVVVIADMTATGRGSGITIQREDALVYRLRGGLIVRTDYFNNRREALEAAGLSK